MWYQIKSRLFFLLKSSNQHGIHSPFVYDLITKCLYDTNYYADYHKLKTLRNELIQNQNSIEVTNQISEPVFNSDNQKISTIAKKSGASFKKQKLLYRLTKYLNPKSILELGTSLGIGTTAMAFANGSNKITTVEGCENISGIAKQVFRKYQLNTIQVKISSFEDFFNNLKTEKLGLVYIDGAHDKKSVIENFNYLLKFCHNDSVFIINEIYGSKKMTEAWDTLKNHKAVSVSIDNFFWGFLFFRKEQSKQHFTIRL